MRVDRVREIAANLIEGADASGYGSWSYFTMIEMGESSTAVLDTFARAALLVGDDEILFVSGLIEKNLEPRHFTVVTSTRIISAIFEEPVATGSQSRSAAAVLAFDREHITEVIVQDASTLPRADDALWPARLKAIVKTDLSSLGSIELVAQKSPAAIELASLIPALLNPPQR